jgi:hypothetical protein
MALCPVSSIMVTHLRGLCDDDLLSVSCKGRIPDMCRSPSPLLDEVVSLATFHEQALGLPAHAVEDIDGGPHGGCWR